MTLQSFANILIIVVLVGIIAFRQLRWRPVVVARMWKLPIIMGAVGLLITVTDTKANTFNGVTVAIVIVELVVSLAIGSAMGAIARFRSPARQAGRSAEFESRTGWVGLALWVALIIVRIGVDVWAGSHGSTVGTSIGVILVVLAANRLARVAVFAARVGKLDSAVTATPGTNSSVHAGR